MLVFRRRCFLGRYCFHLVVALLSGSTVATAEPGEIRKSEPAVWIYVMEPIWRELYHWPPNDYSALQHQENWTAVLKGISAFEFTEKFAAHAEMSELLALTAVLKKNRIMIALQGVPLVAHKSCGLGMESYGTSDETLRTAQRLTSAGIKVNYIVFDEPLLYGHFANGHGSAVGCHLSIQGVADEVMRQVKVLRSSLSDVKIGEVEPVGLKNISSLDWSAALSSYFVTIRRVQEKAIDFFQFDVVWADHGWCPQLAFASSIVASAKLPFGIIFSGHPADHDDAEWTSTIKNDEIALKNCLPLPPSQVIFGSWTDIPRRLVPENNPNTVMGAVLRYLTGLTRSQR